MPSGDRPIVVVGSINIDLVANAERIPIEGETVLGTGFRTHPGGKGANQAAAIARLGYPVKMIGCVGEDVFGSQLRTHMSDAGVDISAVRTVPGPSGVALIVVAKSGENTIVIVPGANASVTPEYLEANIEIIRSAGLVLTQLEIPVETVERLAVICSREDVPLMLDPAPARELPPELMRRVGWFTPNETEAAFFLAAPGESIDGGSPSEIARSLKNLGIQGVVLKLGSRGACLAPADGPIEYVQSFRVQALDTTAAGDAFNGAFATALMLGKPSGEAARFASAAAAISVTREGAQPSMPTRKEVEEMLALTAK